MTKLRAVLGADALVTTPSTVGLDPQTVRIDAEDLAALLQEPAEADTALLERYVERFDTAPLADAIVAALQPQIERAEQERARFLPTEHLGAWGCYHRAMWHSFRFTRSDNAQAVELLQRALASIRSSREPTRGCRSACFPGPFWTIRGIDQPTSARRWTPPGRASAWSRRATPWVTGPWAARCFSTPSTIRRWLRSTGRW